MIDILIGVVLIVALGVTLYYLYNSKTLLSYDELVKLREQGVIDCPLSAIQGTTIDLTLQPIIRVEKFGSMLRTVRLYAGESIDTKAIDMDKTGPHAMMPNSLALGATVETFRLPLNISAEYSLKSTLGRNFLGHMLAGWIDPGFTGTLTLELTNDTQFHKLAIAPNMKIGQVKFFKHRRVPFAKSYAARGQYNGQTLANPAGVLQ